MKTVFCTILSLFGFVFVYAQKIATNEVDKFTGCKIIETSAIKTSRPNIDYKLRALNDTLYICAFIKSQNFKIKENDQSELYIITKEGELILLSGIVRDAQQHEYRSGVHWGFGFSTGSSRILTDCEFVYRVPNEILALLCSNDITDIRISIGKDNIDYQVDGFIAKKFRRLFNLIQ